MLQEEVAQKIRMERIKQEQDEKVWIHNIKLYLTKDPTTFSAKERCPEKTSLALFLNCTLGL